MNLIKGLTRIYCVLENLPFEEEEDEDEEEGRAEVLTRLDSENSDTASCTSVF